MRGTAHCAPARPASISSMHRVLAWRACPKALLTADETDPLLGDLIVDLAVGHVQVHQELPFAHPLRALLDRLVEDLAAVVHDLLMLQFARLQHRSEER